MDPRRLLVFRQVARTGSLAGAARALGWTQPAVSQQVRHLEREAGVPLVVREGRGTSLTEAGRVLLRHADGVADRLAAAEQDLAALAGLVTGSVRVTSFPTAGAVLLPPTLLDLRRRAPGLLVRFEEREPPEAESAVRDGEADVAVVFRHDGERDPVPGDLLREPLVRDEVLLVLPADAPTPADLGALSGSPWIAGCTRCSAHLLRSARLAGFTPDVRFTTDDHVVVQRLVAAGFGVALLPGWALRASPQEGLRTVALPGLASREVELLVRPDAARVPAVAALVGALRTAAGALETAGPAVVR